MDLNEIKSQLIIDEGMSLTAYEDTLGNLTVGIGHLVMPSDQIEEGQTITQDQCDSFFNKDLQIAIDSCTKAPNIPYLNQPELVQESLVNMCYNMGVARLAQFITFLNLLHNKNYEAAAMDLMGTLWAKQVPERAQRIANKIKSCAQ